MAAPKREIELADDRWGKLFQEREQLKRKNTRGEVADFRSRLRWCLLAKYPPFLRDLNEKQKKVHELEPKWMVYFRYDDPNADRLTFTYVVVDPKPVLEIWLFKEATGIFGLPRHFIFQEWYEGFVDVEAPFDDLFSALKKKKEEWHERAGKPPGKPGRPPKEDLGFCDEPQPSIHRGCGIGEGSLFEVSVRISVSLAQLEKDLREVVSLNKRSHKKGKKGRLVPDSNNLRLLESYCFFQDLLKKKPDSFEELFKKHRDKFGFGLLSSGEIKEIYRSNIPELLKFVDPNNIGKYPDHPNNPRPKKARVKDCELVMRSKDKGSGTE
jgi:hypothetical protein